jgi:hypothetical protein
LGAWVFSFLFCFFAFLFLFSLTIATNKPKHSLPSFQPTKQNTNQTLRLLTDPDESIQEQAFAILRNLTESEEGIEMVFSEVGPKVLDIIAATLGGSACACDDVMLQVGDPFYFPAPFPTISHPGRKHPRQPLQHPL